MALRWGYLGAGGIAKTIAADFGHAGLKIQAVATREMERTNAFADQFNIHRTRGGFANNGLDNFERMASEGVAIVDRVVNERLQGRIDPASNRWFPQALDGPSQGSPIMARRFLNSLTAPANIS